MKQTLKKPPYKVNLIKQHGLCERNYHKLIRLLPNLNQQDVFILPVHHGNNEGNVSFRVQQRSKYTTTLMISLDADWNRWLTMPTLYVQLYHDALMAEVIRVTSMRTIEPVYSYPNDKMLQPDEKAQLNQLLSDLLNYCFSSGFTYCSIV